MGIEVIVDFIIGAVIGYHIGKWVNNKFQRSVGDYLRKKFPEEDGFVEGFFGKGLKKETEK